MTTFYLIRHATNDWLARGMAGRQPGVHLNAEGRQQAEWIAERLKSAEVQRLYSSPLERAQETAAPLAEMLGLEVEICEGFHEVDCGDWTGKTFRELSAVPEWEIWNRFRSGNQIPNGETMSAVQTRIIEALMQISRRYRDGVIAIFSHGDPIRAALAYYLGIPIDLISRFDISPASISTLRLSGEAALVLKLNERCGKAY
jgi:probable phosphomutase (TIGR03848 family)